jgi:hypothetical protein
MMSDVVGAVSVNKIGYLLFYSRGGGLTLVAKNLLQFFEGTSKKTPLREKRVALLW